MTIRESIFSYFKERHGLSDEDLASDLPLLQFVDSLGLLELLTFIQKDLALDVDLIAISPENFGTPSLVVAYVEGQGR